MVETVLIIIRGLLVLGVLIFVHELGHFLLAKYNKVGVLEFAIGFGRKIWQKRIGETRYSIGIIPLGGYVRMVGDDPRDLDAAPDGEDADLKREEKKKVDGFSIQTIDEDDCPEVQALLADRSKWFVEKGYFAKLSIVFAGPGFNLIFAWMLSVFVFFTYGYSIPSEGSVLGDIAKDHPAEAAGLKSGDKVTSIDGKPILLFKDLAEAVRGSGGEEMKFTVERMSEEGETETVELSVTGKPQDKELALVLGQESKKTHYIIGVQPEEAKRAEVGFTDSLRYGSIHIWKMTELSVRSFVLMVAGAISPTNIAGPISIVNLASEQAQRGVESLMLFMIFLSVSLAVLNLLPIPILDGGHIMFFTLEALMGRPVSMKVQDMANQVGMVLLLALMLFAVGNDIYRLTGLGG